MSENKQTTDNELLLQIVGYNSDAFEQLFNRYSSPIYSFIKEIVSNPKLAEKILLDVFSIFLKRIEYFSTTNNNVFTYLTLLTRNVALDEIKRMKFIEDMPIYSDEYEINFILPSLSSEISPINLDDRIILGEKIKAYKNHLTEIQNLVLSLVYFEGLNEEEIAKRLNVSAVTVRQKIIAIMENLYHQYTGQSAENTTNSEILSLIKLEALGCLLSKERILLNKQKENDPDFLWKELGEYQNLTALLSTSVSVEPLPHDFRSEISGLFTKILQVSDVDLSVALPELSDVEPIAEPFVAPIPEPIPQKVVIPEVKENEETEFHIKFRNPDPKELTLFRQTDPVHTTQKPNPVFAERVKSTLTNKEVLPAVVENDIAVQNKFSSGNVKNPDLQIKNTDPSIVIEDPRPEMVKDDVVNKNRLIPNSSINLKDILKKDEKETQSKTSAPVADKIDIKSSANESAKETKIFNPFIDNKIGSSPNKQTLTVTRQSDIKIKTNKPPKELLGIISFADKDNKAVQSNPVNPVVKKPDTKTITNELPKEVKTINPAVQKDIKVPQNKTTDTAAGKSDLKFSAADSLKSKEEIKPVISKDNNSTQRIEPSVDKTSLKIRETSFVENDKKTIASKIEEEKPVVLNAQTKTQKIYNVNKIKESINVDEVLFKHADAKPETLIENLSYETEIEKPKKNSKRNILAAAALFAVLAVSGTFVYLKLQDNPVKVAEKIKSSVKEVVNEQVKLELQNDLQPVSSSSEVSNGEKELPLDQKKTEPKVPLPKLPESTTKEESTYFAMNEKSDLISTAIKENDQIAAAKTENIIPPKEEKKIEEEPAFFLAVEEMPELIGGIKELQSKIVYPKIAKQVGTEGKVIIQAVVDETGKVISANTIKGIGAGCDEVALDAVLNSKFKPGKQRGKNVKVQVTIPIVFKK